MRKVLLFIIMVVCAVPISAQGTIDVRILNKLHPKKVTVCKKEGGSQCIKLKYTDEGIDADGAGINVRQKKSILIYNGETGDYIVTVGNNKGIHYRGMIQAQFLEDEREVALILHTGIEDYVSGVIAKETEESLFNKESVKALSVVARTYAYENKNRHKFYDLCDLSHCQQFKGVPGEKWYRCVYETEGLILKKRKGNSGFFSGNCGGYIEDADCIWKYNMCRDKREDSEGKGIFCKNMPGFHWSYDMQNKYAKKTAEKVLKEKVKKLLNIKIYSALPSGRVKNLELTVLNRNGEENKIVNAERFIFAFGNLYGYGNIHSTFFTIEKKNRNYHFDGHGQGHGAGLCMAGAYVMAKQGYSYTEILKHYFPDAQVVSK